MKHLFSYLTAVALLSMSGVVVAGNDSGFYLGASLGAAQVDYSESVEDFGEVSFDDDATGYKIFGGYNLGIVPIVDVAVEAAYVDFGEFNGRVDNVEDNKLDVTGFTLAGLVGANLGPVGLFGKVGAINWDGDLEGGLGNSSDDGTNPLYGAGAKIQLGKFQVRAEYELFDLENIDIDYFSIGAAYTF